MFQAKTPGVHQALSQISSDLTTTGKAAKGAGNSFSQLASGYTAILVARYAARGIGALVKPAIEADAALQKLSGVTGATGVELEKFHKTAVASAGISPYGVPEMLDAQTQLKLVTGSNIEAMKSLDTVTKVTMASFDELTTTQSAEAFGSIMKGFNMTGDQTREAMAQMAGAAQIAGVKIAEVTPVMDKLGRAAALSGQSFQSMMATLALTKRGYKSVEAAGTSLVRLMVQLRTAKAREVLERAHGIKVLDAETHAMRPLQDIMLDMTKAYKANPEAMRDTLVKGLGVKSGLQPLAIMLNRLNAVGDAGQEYIRIQEAMANGQAYLQQQEDAYLRTIKARLTLLSQSFENLAASVGSVVLPALGTALGLITEMVNIVRTVLDKAPIIKQFIAVTAGIMAMIVAVIAAKAAFIGLGIIIGKVFAMVGAAGATAGMSLSAFLIPLGVTIAGLVGLKVLLEHLAEWLLGKKLDLSFFEAAAELWAMAKTGFTDIDAYAKANIQTRKLLADKALAEKKAEQDKIRVAEKVKQLAVEGADFVKDRYHIANVETLEVLKEIKGLAKWKPIILKESAYQQALSRMGGLGADRNLPMRQQMAMQMASQETMPEIMKLIKKSMEGSITPEEHIKLSAMAQQVLLAVKDVEALAPGSFGKRIVDNLEKFAIGAIDLGSKENVAASSSLRGYQSKALDWQWERGENRRAKQAKKVPFVFGAQTTGDKEGESILPGGPGVQNSPEYIEAQRQTVAVEKSAKSLSWLERQAELLRGMLEHGVRIDTDKPDPMAPSGIPSNMLVG